MKRRATILQTCVPDYRLAFFRELLSRIDGLSVAAGSDYFAKSVLSAAGDEPWITKLENVFLFNRSLLWQRGALAHCRASDSLIVEWNPRVLSTWILLFLRRLTGRKTFVWGHARSHQRLIVRGQLVRDLMAWAADGIIAYTATEAIICRCNHPGAPVWSAPNSSQSIKAMGSDAPMPQTAINVVYVGRLTSEKKPQVLLKAWQLFVSKAPRGSRLIIVGDGPERARLDQLVADLGLEASVALRGHIADELHLREIYRECLVAVSPGYVGLSAIQCMAHGVPMAISRDEPHSPEIEACYEGFNCRFFKTDDPADLASVLSSFYEERETWLSKRREISAAISREYTVERMARGFADALAGLMPAEREPMRAALVWQQYGPYHQARLKAFREGQKEFHVIALEMAAKTGTYQWQRAGHDTEIHALETERPAEKLAALTVYRRAVRFFRLADIRVVFVPSYWPPTSLAILLAAHRVGACAVMMNESHEHTSRATGVRQLLKRRLVRAFDAALVGGTPQRVYFESLGMAPRTVFEGYDAVDNSYFRMRSDQSRQNARQLREQFNLPERYFLNVGRMEPKKNLPILISAYAIARREDAGLAPLVLVGDGATEADLRRQCVREGLNYADMTGTDGTRGRSSPATDVLFYGFRQIAETPIFYALASAFILPSLWEEWGLVVNEAMAAGLPVVVSRVVGCAPDLVTHGETGFIFDPENAKELAGYLRQLNDDPVRAHQMGQRGREAIEEWGLEKFARNARLAAMTALRT